MRTYPIGPIYRTAQTAIDYVDGAAQGDKSEYTFDVRGASSFQVYRTRPAGPVRAQLDDCVQDFDAAMNADSAGKLYIVRR